MSRRALVAAALTAGIGFHADVAGASDKTPSFASLPSVSLAQSTAKMIAPKSIPASEKVDGFAVITPDYMARKISGKSAYPGPFYMTLSSSVERAQGTSRPDSSPAMTCFSAGGQVDARGEAINWTGALQESVSLMSGKHDAYYGAQGGVRLVRGEKLDLADKEHPKLENTIAWVDPDTHGVRLVSKSSHELKKIGSAPGGAEVYAARDGNTVEVVFSNGSSRRGSAFPITFSSNANNFGGSACSHAALTISAPISGTTDLATFLTQVIVGETERLTDDGKPTGMKDVRVRSLKLSASLSWLGRDKAPVLSLAVGWAEAEQIETM